MDRLTATGMKDTRGLESARWRATPRRTRSGAGEPMTKGARSFDIVIVGAGAAGLGFGGTLRDLGIENFVILDRAEVGASFLRWPRQMRFITPSFNSTQFGALDLNAVCLHTSPAYSIGVEHPTGEEYAGYLRGSRSTSTCR